MISYDWKIRLRKDCNEFVKNNIPKRDYDFEVIYIAYPERINGKIPPQIITFVAKEMRKTIAKNPDEAMDFLSFIHKNKGATGEKIFTIIMQKIILLHPKKYSQMLTNLIFETKNEKSLNKIFDNIIFPLMKKFPEKYIDKFFEWLLSSPSNILIENIFRILNKYLKTNKGISGEIFKKCESLWNSDNQFVRDGNVLILKTLYKVDKKLYREIYQNYQKTYNPNFIEILASAVSENSEMIKNCIEKWTKSGNVKIKKSASVAKKNLTKIKKKK